ncbi:MAG: hypothetical protein ACI3VS_01110 [Evtepia sp.]
MKITKRVAFPRYAEYNCALKYFVEQGLDATYILQPALTRRTEELGAKYSPDFVCTPFKTVLGSMIEALEAGADTIFMTHGLCRLGYFGELQEQILRDLGYTFDFVNLSEYSTGKKRDWLRAIKRVNPKPNLGKLTLRAWDTIKMAQYLDQVTDFYYQNCGFDATGGQYKQIYQQFISGMYTAASKQDIQVVYQRAMDRFQRVPLDKPARPLRVGVVGELYTVMDPFSNLELEQKLADMGVEIHRWMSITNRLIHYPGENNLNPEIRDLCTYEMGPTSTANIWCAKKYAQQGFDGLIHIKSANCTPEIDIMPVLQNISSDYKIPLLCLTYDSQTSDVGLMTRLEAFYDMIDAKKRVRR